MYHLKFATGQLVLASFLLAVSIVAQAQPDVTVGNGTTQPGGTVSIPVSFTNNGAVVGFNFDITYDTTVITAVDLSNCNGNDMDPGGVTCNSPSAGTISIAVATFPLANVASTQIGTIDFTISGTAPLAPTTLTVANASFSDASAGAVSPGTLTNGTITVQAAPAASIAVTPTTGTFAAENGSGTNQLFTVTNDGNADGLLVTSATISGADADNFEIVSLLGGSPCPSTGDGLAVGATCGIAVRFSPDSVGNFTASLDIVSNGGNESIALNGTGTLGPAGSIKVTPPSTVDFGELLTDLETESIVFTAQNLGDVDSVVAITSVSLSSGAPYSITANACDGAELGYQETCTVTVKFAPTSDGVATSALTVSGTDINDTPYSDTSAMTGKGVTKPIPTSNPVSGTSESEIVGPEGSNDFTVVWGNDGNEAYDVSCSLTDGYDSDVWSVTNATATVEPGESHTVTTACSLPDTETYTETLTCSIGEGSSTFNYECVGLPPLPVPVDNKWALALLALMMLMAASFGFRFIARQ